MKKIRVLVIDDSSLAQKVITEILSQDEMIEVVGAALDPYIARDMIKKLKPDVLTLDIEMPKMDGLSFLRNLMRLRPMPVVMISTLTEKGAEATLEALSLGAIDCVHKPNISDAKSLKDYSHEIIFKVKTAATARLQALASEQRQPAPVNSTPSLGHLRNNCLIAIGASTGGTEAIKTVLSMLPAKMPPIVISQHIPVSFSSSFAKRLDSQSQLNVCEVSDGQVLKPGHAYLAPGDDHLIVEPSRYQGQFICRLLHTDPVNRHRPSVDVMFDSVAEHFGKQAIAALLTGMGADGAKGLLHLRQQGGHTIVQDENTSVVWGMPGAAYKLGGADQVLGLTKIASQLVKQAYIG